MTPNHSLALQSSQTPLTSLDIFQLAAAIANAAESKKALDTVILDAAQVSNLADYFVICSGESPTQIRAIAEAVETVSKEMGVEPIGEERDTSGRWYLLDFGDVVVHIMHRHERQYYDLEKFWSHAGEVNRETWGQQAS